MRILFSAYPLWEEAIRDIANLRIFQRDKKN